MSDSRVQPSVYRERLSPSLWVIVSAAIVAPMASLVFLKADAAWALAVGIIVGAAIIVAMFWAAPVVEVRGGELRVGRAHVDVGLLGDPEVLQGDAAREARGPGLSATAWHMLRGGIDGVVRVPLEDADDPIDQWVFSTRTPDRIAAAIRRAQAR